MKSFFFTQYELRQYGTLVNNLNEIYFYAWGLIITINIQNKRIYIDEEIAMSK